MNASAATGRVQTPARLAAGARVGAVTVTGPLRVTAVAEAYQAETADGPATLYILHEHLAASAAVRDAVLGAARRAAALPAHNHLVRTLGAGTDDGHVWVLTEALDGSTMRDLLTRKRQAGQAAGFGARGAGNLIVGVAAGLAAGGVHGGITTDSVVVSRNGRVRVADLPLGAGVAASVAAGLIPAASHVAPEIAKGAAPSTEADVYALGALLYEGLVGRALERGGPRPSDAVPGLTQTVDELIARCCAPKPDNRFGSIEVVKELVADALARGGAVDEPAPAPSASSPRLTNPSLASGIAAAAAASSPSLPVAEADPALAAALANTTEKWLIAKGRLDYGPFSLEDVVAQIRRGEIVAGNVIIDKDTGGRVDVAEHPLLGPIVDQAKQAHDDARRAQAEVHHETKQKKRGALLAVMIVAALGVIGAVVYALVTRGKDDGGGGAVADVEKVGGASLAVTMSPPKQFEAPKKKKSGGGGRRSGGGGGGGGWDDDEVQSLDLSGDESDDETSGSPLDMGTVYEYYSRKAGALGGCMSSAGISHVTIRLTIAPTGSVSSVKTRPGSAQGCISGVLKKIRFPEAGARTRAEFDIDF